MSPSRIRWTGVCLLAIAVLVVAAPAAVAQDDDTDDPDEDDGVDAGAAPDAEAGWDRCEADAGAPGGDDPHHPCPEIGASASMPVQGVVRDNAGAVSAALQAKKDGKIQSGYPPSASAGAGGGGSVDGEDGDGEPLADGGAEAKGHEKIRSDALAAAGIYNASAGDLVGVSGGASGGGGPDALAATGLHNASFGNLAGTNAELALEGNPGGEGDEPDWEKKVLASAGAPAPDHPVWSSLLRFVGTVCPQEQVRGASVGSGDGVGCTAGVDARPGLPNGVPGDAHLAASCSGGVGGLVGASCGSEAGLTPGGEPAEPLLP